MRTKADAEERVRAQDGEQESPSGDSNPGWRRDAGDSRKYWDDFYRKFDFRIPSQFACFVASELRDAGLIYDLACGTARDSLFFSRLGHRVVAVDASETVIEKNRQTHRIEDLAEIEFHRADVCVQEDLERLLGHASEGSGKVAVYSRFFVHSIDDAQEELFRRALSTLLPSGASCFFEFRTDQDASRPKTYGRHFRRYVCPTQFVERFVDGGAFDCQYAISGFGMAKFGDEDPHVARIVLVKT